MYINFQQNWVGRSVKTVHTNVFAKKNANCINLQLAIRILKNHVLHVCNNRFNKKVVLIIVYTTP